MRRTLSLLAIGVCANALVGLSAQAQATPEVTLTRFDCGTGVAPIDPARFSENFTALQKASPFDLPIKLSF